ncbi:MAG: iron-siderophore ABC transporter substrate-binding protein [Pleurocapsa sp. MO_226.B13]|nr:iron-siderophore ABC transporter substrate-binding protein [Pleurocapsa sp. MO_226.B13]
MFWGIFTAMLVVACSSTNDVSSSRQSDDCRVIQHTMGKTCIPRNPQRVVTLRTDHLANSLALGVQLIASAFVEGFPVSEVLQDRVDKIETVGDINNPSLEKILLLKPDLIISNSRLESIYPQLSQIAPTVVLDLPFPPSPWKEQFKELAQILDKEETYPQLMAEYWQRIENLKQALGDRSKKLEISIAGTASGAGIWAYGEKHPVGDILNDIGLQRPPIQRGNFYYLENISEEKLSDIDGDILFLTSWGREEDREIGQKLSQKPLWQKLKVVRQKQVYVVGHYWHNAGNILAVNAILDDLEKYLLNSFSDS